MVRLDEVCPASLLRGQSTIVCRFLPRTGPLLPCTFWGNTRSDSVLYDTRGLLQYPPSWQEYVAWKENILRSSTKSILCGILGTGDRGHKIQCLGPVLAFSFADWSSICGPRDPELLPTASLASVGSEECQGTEHVEILRLHFPHP